MDSTNTSFSFWMNPRKQLPSAKDPQPDIYNVDNDYAKRMKELSNYDSEFIMNIYSSGIHGLKSGEADIRLSMTGENVITFPEQLKKSTKKIALAVSNFMKIRGKIMDSKKAAKCTPVDIVEEYVPTMTCVLRDRLETIVCTHELVLGDIIILKPGTWIPADLFIIKNENLSVIDHIFGGELRSLKVPEPMLEHIQHEDSSFDFSNILWMGTEIKSGQGIGIIVETGKRTALGRMINSIKY